MSAVTIWAKFASLTHSGFFIFYFCARLGQFRDCSGGWHLSQLSSGGTQSTPWTDRQRIRRPTQRHMRQISILTYCIFQRCFRIINWMFLSMFSPPKNSRSWAENSNCTQETKTFLLQGINTN